ncbi:MAG: diguanylate cyclase (GGDEF)-like protein/PAS domain S-box-containing protein [Paraglaciecola psychrophila]|jgi:diguanylate cyclase (GGDEF)-like protein/PAS domain S-box-containing protein
MRLLIINKKFTEIYRMQAAEKNEFLHDQLQTIFKFYPVAISGSFLLVLLNVFALWPVAPTRSILTWLLLAVVVSLHRTLLYILHKNNSERYSAKTWLIHNEITSALSGLHWGLGLYFLVPDNSPAHILAFVIAVAGLVAGSASTQSISPRAFVLFMICALVPTSLRLYALDQQYGWLLFIMSCIYMLFMWQTCRRNGSNVLHNIKQAISLRQQAMDLAASARLMDLHFDSSPLGLIEWDKHLTIRRWNPAAAKIFGYLESEVVQKKPDLLLADDAGKKYFKALVQKSTSAAATLENWTKSGTAINCEWVSTPLEDLNHTLLGYTSFVTDITERIEQQKLVTHQAFFDAVTDLPNRRYFHQRLGQEVNRVNRSGCYSAVLFMDLDHFKNINDSLGHALGDELLKQFAKRLEKRLRQHEILARLGGDEFVVLLEELDPDLQKSQIKAAQVATILQTLIQEPFLLENNPYSLTCSIGITLFNNDQCGEDELLKQADLALYDSKHRGRNCYSFFKQEMSDNAFRHLTLLNNLREAIDREEFSMVYQPKVDMKSNELKGAETLLRWNNQELGSIAPDEFIPILESSTLIIPVGLWVLEHSFKQLQQWQLAGQWHADMRLAINISPRQLLDVDFIVKVNQLMEKYALSASSIEFEITENVLVQDVDRVSTILHTLAELGISFSIDDFGTGYSSLSYLKKLPIEVLKIDKSFVDHCTDVGNDQAIVRSILSICNELGLTSVAEGVETLEQQQLLQSMGCDLLQGYLISKPISASEFTDMLEA